MNKKYKLKGHETFSIREGWMNKGIEAVHDNPKVFSENHGSDALGVGTNMAKSIRYWMHAMGLIEKKKEGIFLTEFGQMVYDYDRYVEDIFTLWMMHIHIVKNAEYATCWNLFFQSKFLHDRKEFTKSDLQLWLMREVQAYTGKEDISERSVQDDCNILLHMYNQQNREKPDPEDKKISPFAGLQLLKQEGTRYKRTAPKMDTLHPYVVWYVLSELFAQSDNINIQNIVEDENGLGRILHLGRIEVNYYLDLLEEDGLITINRTAGLDMVYEKVSCTAPDIMKKYYEGGH